MDGTDGETVRAGSRLVLMSKQVLDDQKLWSAVKGIIHALANLRAKCAEIDDLDEPQGVKNAAHSETRKVERKARRLLREIGTSEREAELRILDEMF